MDTTRWWARYASARVSVDRLLELHTYCSSQASKPPHRAWSSLFVTQLPAVAAVLLSAALPLQPLSSGVAHSHLFWVHAWISVAIFATAIIIQLDRFAPAVRMRRSQNIIMVLATSTSATASVIPIGVFLAYPIPFAFTTGTPFFLVTFVPLLYRFVGSRHVHAQSKALRLFLVVLLIQYAQTMTYVTFTFVLVRLEPHVQPYFVLLLVVIKFSFKILYANVMNDLTDLKPVFIVLTVEVFHSLFVSVSLQSSPSRVTSIVIVGLDVLMAVRSLHGIHGRTTKLQLLLTSKQNFSNDSAIEPSSPRPPLLDCAVVLLQEMSVYEGIRATQPKQQVVEQAPRTAIVPSQADTRTTRSIAAIRRQATLLRLTDDQHTRLKSLSPEDKIAFVQQTLELLHKTQTFLLAEYVEVVVPLVYAFFVSIVPRLPNREFYRLFRDLSEASIQRIVGTVLLYAALELVTLLPLDRILRKRLGFRPIHQLTFVLESDSLLIRSELALWFVYMLQTSLEHYGFDLSFRFAWLRSQPGSA